jgi:hypothetical protein
MLVYGTCNPEGLYLTDADIRAITPQMQGESTLCFGDVECHQQE